MSKYYVLNLSRRATKLMFRRLGVRFPTGKYHLCKESTFEPPCTVTPCLDAKAEVHIGAFSSTDGWAGEGIFTNARVGRYCSIAKHAKLWLSQHPVNWLSTTTLQYNKIAFGWNMYMGKTVSTCNFHEIPPVEIGNDVWIGNGACIMGGIKIGDGAIIATNAVVTHDVPPYAIVGGVPARVIRYRFDEDTIKELLELRWWQYDIADFGDIKWGNAKEAIKSIKQKITSKSAPAIYKPKLITGKEMFAYSSRCLFFFEFSNIAIRIKVFGLWIVHFVFSAQSR